MLALFVGAFAVTLMLQHETGQAPASFLKEPAVVPAVSVEPSPAAEKGSHAERDAAFPEVEPLGPSLVELALDEDPDTRAEARTLLDLLDNESLPEG